MSMPTSDIISPDDATGFVQGAFDGASNDLPFNKILPNMNADALPEGITADLMTISWVPNVRQKFDDGAVFRAFDAEVPYDKSFGSSVRKYAQMHPIGKRHRITEADIATNGLDSYDSEKVGGYFDKLGRETAFMLESAKLKTVVEAKNTYAGNGINGSDDFGRSADLTVTPGTKWSDASANVVDDIHAYQELVYQHDGMVPTTLVLNRKVLNLLTQNKNLISLFFAKSTGLPSAIKRTDVLSLLSEYADISGVLVADEEYEKYFQKNNLVRRPMLADDTVLFLPGLGNTGIGVTAIGPTAEARVGTVNNPNNIGLIGVMQETPSSTPSYDLYVNGTVLPVLAQPDSTLVATVL